MNLLVALRPVLDPAGFIVHRKAQRVFVNRENYLLNPADRNALEAALQAAAKEDQVVAVALGSAEADDALRQARAMGASRALLVRDSALKQAGASATVRVLQHVVDRLGGADLILLGDEVLDADLAQVGPRLAAALDRPFVEAALGLTLTSTSVRAILRRPDGYHQYEAELPAVVSVARNSNKPRYAHGASLLNVYRARDTVETLTLAELQLTEADLTPLTELRGESFPPERESGKRLEGTPEEMAAQLADALRKA
jgi:electron transfer flavoprotein beta subunit